jgi:allantoinase
MRLDLVFTARRVITPEGEVARTVGVRDGRVVLVGPYGAEHDAARVEVLGDDVVLLPGLVDTHVHVNDPGRSEWEGFATATRAAAAGGVTTIIDMPLNSLPPTVDVAALVAKRAAALGRVHVDVGFWGGVVPGNLGELRALHDAGVFGFKCFLLPSGVDEFPQIGLAELGEALRVLAPVDGLVIVHAEDAAEIDHAPPPAGRAYDAFLASRPRAAEDTAITGVVRVARDTGGRVHVLHLSSSGALPIVAAAKRDGVRLTAETCPHYLTFTAEEIADGATQFKCCPPIREAANRERLWSGLADGTIDVVVSDHSPCTPDLKRFDVGDFGAAWGGVASLQLGLSAVWTQARQRGHALPDVVAWTATGPAALAGLRRKGSVEVGKDADFCVFAPDEAFVVDRERLHHRNPVTPYHGRPLAGVVRSTWLRGEEIIGDRPRGRLLARGDA